MLVNGGLEVRGFCKRRDDPRRDPDAQPECVDLRRPDVVEVAARLVVGVDVSRGRPRRRVAQPVDQLLDDAHPHRDVRGRMLVPASREAGDDPRDVGQRALVQVGEEVLLVGVGAHVVRESLPEKEDVVGVAERNAVHADVVDLPAHAGVLEQVEDDRVVEDAVAPHAVGRDPAGGAGRGVEAVRPGRTELRAEVVRAEGRCVMEAVVEGQVARGVVAHAVDAVGRVEPVHRAAVVLRVGGGPVVADVGRREAGEVIRRDGPAAPVWLRVARGHAGLAVHWRREVPSRGRQTRRQLRQNHRSTSPRQSGNFRVDRVVPA